jgi:hypothetical protein
MPPETALSEVRMKTYTENEVRAMFDHRMRKIRELLDALPRQIARTLPADKRFQVERLARIHSEKYLAQQPTFEQFLAKIKERHK